MVIMSRFGFRKRPQWLQCPKLILRICYNGYHVQNEVQKEAPVVTVPKIDFKNMLQWLSCPDSGSERGPNGYSAQN
jgi:hypothetical protein